MKIRHAFHRFEPTGAAIINISDVDLCWSGLATLAGPSGSGKTTLFRLLSAWYDGPDSACVFEPDVDRYRRVRFVGAHESLLPWKSVGGNFEYRGVSREEATRMLGEMELSSEVLDLPPYELSYGMYKRVELAIAVRDDPELLLLDEFFTSIDDAAKRSIRDYLWRERAEAKTWATAHEEELRNWLSCSHFSLSLDKVTRCVIDVLPSE
jgi:ABC-type nitrate/sulfonate/bicarbonate transport system ATPase subunit